MDIAHLTVDIASYSSLNGGLEDAFQIECRRRDSDPLTTAFITSQQFSPCIQSVVITYGVINPVILGGRMIRRLQNLTTAMRLDYYKFMNDIDHTSFYAARQMEVVLPQNYTPQIILVRKR